MTKLMKTAFTIVSLVATAMASMCTKGTQCFADILNCCSDWGDVCCTSVKLPGAFCCEEGCCQLEQPEFLKWSPFTGSTVAVWVVGLLLVILIILLSCMVCRYYIKKQQPQPPPERPRPRRRRAVYEVLAGQVFPAYTVVPGAMDRRYQAPPGSIIWYSPQRTRRGPRQSSGAWEIPTRVSQTEPLLPHSPPPPYDGSPPPYNEAETELAAPSQVSSSPNT